MSRARWQSGHAADCKSVYLGSTPGRASINLAQVVKSVDTRDLKSLGLEPVRVQVPPWAPSLKSLYYQYVNDKKVSLLKIFSTRKNN